MTDESSGWGWRPIVEFVVVTFAWTWGWWIPLVATGAISREGQGWPTHAVGLLGPAIGAVVVTGLHEGRAGLIGLSLRVVRWRVAFKWWALVGATALLVLLPLFLEDGVKGGEFFRYSGLPAIGLLTVLLALVVNGFGEEIGWRGYLAERLLRRFSLAVTSVLVWVVWVVWHLPMFWVVANFRDFTAVETVGWLVGLLLGSVFLTWLYRSADHSILIVAVWHTAYNFSTATTATSGATAAVASTVVMVAALAVLARRTSWRAVDQPGPSRSVASERRSGRNE